MMGSRKRNPFEVFGITPEIVERLAERELFDLVRSVYRSLVKVYHPDKCRTRNGRKKTTDPTTAYELNLAFERLDLEKTPDSFKKWRKSYSAQRQNALKRKIEALEKGLRLQRQREAILADGYMTFLLQGLPWSQDNGGDPCRTALNLANVKLGLNDVAINHNVRSLSWNMGGNYKEIIFDALGGMFYRPVGRSKAFPASYIHLLGVIEVDRVDLPPLLDRVPPRNGFFKSPALDSRYGIDGAPLQIQNSISLEKFKNHCLPVLEPELSERSYLFSIHRPIFEQEERISLEGVIVKISKP